jgi:putative tryptophan/tyrosine transport system substrate-binding protein
MSLARNGLAFAVVLVLTACSTSSEQREALPEATVAFLRAVSSANSDTQRILLGELRSVGLTAGSNLTVLAEEPDVAYPDPDDAAEIVAEWVDQGVDLIFGLSSSGAMVASQAAPNIPVLFISNDPTATGLIENESQPEGNLTGVTYRVPADRTLSIALRALPGLKKLGLVYPAEDPGAGPHTEAVRAATERLGIDLEMARFTDDTDAAGAVAKLDDANVDAIFISNSPTAIRAVDQIQGAADAAGIPTIANTGVATGALVMLGPNSIELYRQLGRQAARILAGTEVADVPVEDPRDFELILNVAIANQLGIVLSPELLREANRITR